MDQSLFWEANWYQASQEIHIIIITIISSKNSSLFWEANWYQASQEIHIIIIINPMDQSLFWEADSS
jgi:hypothetical protein